MKVILFQLLSTDWKVAQKEVRTKGIVKYKYMCVMGSCPTNIAG